MQTLTNSRIKCYRACPRRHHYAYELGVKPVERSFPLRFGTLIHTALEAWWTASVDRLGAATTAVFAAGALDPALDDFEYIRASELIRGYHYRWSEEPIETISVEREFAFQIAPDMQIAGKIDAIARTADGFYNVEHKTSAEDISPGSAYWQRLLLDSQVSTYHGAAKELGYDIRGTLYDVICRPSQRPFKATPETSRKYTAAGKLYANQRAADETPEEFRERLRADIADKPDEYFQRGIVVRTESEEAEAKADLLAFAQLIQLGLSPRNPDSCRMYGSTCSYLPVCSGTASIDDPLRFRKAEKINEELSL